MHDKTRGISSTKQRGEQPDDLKPMPAIAFNN
jgi:hypothetical protein